MKKNILEIKNLHSEIDNKEILKGISLTIKSGEVHAIMGPNGSGKSTLAYVLMGHPIYKSKVKSKMSKVIIGQKDVTDLPSEERARAGLFLALQSPVAIPGVSVMNLLRTAYQEIYGKVDSKKEHTVQNPLLSRGWHGGDLTLEGFMALVKKQAKILKIDESWLSRSVHDGFSGGEKKKIEMLQALVLSPKFAIFDEIDTGLDVDALRLVALGIKQLSKNGTGIIIITHYQRILKYLKPDVIHILVNGKILKTGKAILAKQIEKKGYGQYANING